MTSRRKNLALICQGIGRMLTEELSDTTTGPPMGYMLMVFDFGDESQKADKFSAYMSNANAADVARLLREQADHLEARVADDAERAKHKGGGQA